MELGRSYRFSSSSERFKTQPGRGFSSARLFVLLLVFIRDGCHYFFKFLRFIHDLLYPIMFMTSQIETVCNSLASFPNAIFMADTKSFISDLLKSIAKTIAMAYASFVPDVYEPFVSLGKSRICRLGMLLVWRLMRNLMSKNLSSWAHLFRAKLHMSMYLCSSLLLIPKAFAIFTLSAGFISL